jgi:two-component system, cell cycle response regulator
MGSFKFKLVAYFLLLAVVPLAAAFWGFTSIAARSETRRADATLQSSLRAAVERYDERLEAVTRRGERVVRRPEFARALASRRRVEVARMLAGEPGLRVEAAGLRVGAPPPLAAERHIQVFGPRGLLGEVVAAVPLDAGLLRRLAGQSGLDREERLAIARGDRIVVGPAGRFVLAAGQPETVSLGRSRYRGLSSGQLRNAPDVSLVALIPQHRIDAAKASSERRLLLALVGVLGLVGLVAYLEGRSIVRSVQRLVRAANAIAAGEFEGRVPVSGRDELATLARSFNDMADQLAGRLKELDAEHERLEGAIRLFGEALAATHDVDQLLRVVLDAELEATGATGGMVIADGRVAAEVGKPTGGARIEVPLRAGETNFGRLVLTGTEFSEEAQATAKSLAAHAAIALDNARLHGIVERQAVLDELTGLANRRQAQEMLVREIARAERFSTPIGFVLCDLDNFKDVNDRYGHLVGDEVLRALAAVLMEVVRTTDLAARWGGEEFALLLPSTDVDGAAHVAERAREALEERTLMTHDGEAIRVTASFGVAAFPEHGRGDDLVAAADLALYAAKRLGKNRVETGSTGVLNH